MSWGSPPPRWGARPRLFLTSPLVRFVSRLSHPLLSHPTVFLYLSRPIDMQRVQPLRVLPPQHPKQPDLPQEARDEAREQQADDERRAEAGDSPLPAGHVLVLGGAVEHRSERKGPDHIANMGRRAKLGKRAAPSRRRA